MKNNTQQILNTLHIISWILFAGICVEAGAFIVHTILMIVHPEGAPYYWKPADLTDLFRFGQGYFVLEMTIMSLANILKAVIFYFIIKLLHDKQLNLAQPFNKAVQRFIFRLAYMSLVIGAVSYLGMQFADWFTELGVNMPDDRKMSLSGADVWIFMGVILLVIAQIFKRGIEIQTENELTV